MKELIDRYVGKEYEYNHMGMTFKCIIKDVRMSYGNAQVLIVPVVGNGSKWVNV